MEARLMLWVHGFTNPWFDGLAWLTHQAGTRWAGVVIVGLAVCWHARQAEWRRAAAWIVTGVAVWGLQFGLKALVQRPRPEFWPRTFSDPVDFSFPSGHAVSSAAFFPLLAALLARRFPARAGWIWSAGVAVAFTTGLGRVYLGVHWPTDVFAGWVIGAALCWCALRWGGDGDSRVVGQPPA